MAFEDAMLDRPHKAPAINKRQVWARMVSQLIVKSEVGIGWGGKTIWLLQDVLVNYISSSTALDVRRFLATKTSQVNMLSFTYSDAHLERQSGVIELNADELFAGPIGSVEENPVASFQDIIRAPAIPTISKLFGILSSKRRVNEAIVPAE